MPDMQAILAVMSGIIAIVAIVLAWMMPDKTLFNSLASMVIGGGILTVINYYFGSSKKPPSGGPDAPT